MGMLATCVPHIIRSLVSGINASFCIDWSITCSNESVHRRRPKRLHRGLGARQYSTGSEQGQWVCGWVCVWVLVCGCAEDECACECVDVPVSLSLELTRGPLLVWQSWSCERCISIRCIHVYFMGRAHLIANSVPMTWARVLFSPTTFRRH